MTEATHQIASNTLASRVAGAVGKAAGPEIAIFGDSDEAMPPDQEGRVVIRGTNVIDGYTDPEATAKAFVGRVVRHRRPRSARLRRRPSADGSQQGDDQPGGRVDRTR